MNRHIRSVADGYAEDGFLRYSARIVRPRRALPSTQLWTRGPQATRVGLDAALKDISATIAYAEHRFGPAKVGVVGYCWGGTLAWLAATRLRPAAPAAYYGGQIAGHAAEQPRCPMMLHFGEKDQHIPPSKIETIRQHHPDLPVYLYDAGHGFNCDQRKSYDPASAALTRARSSNSCEIISRDSQGGVTYSLLSRLRNVLYVFLKPHYNCAAADARLGTAGYFFTGAQA